MPSLVRRTLLFGLLIVAGGAGAVGTSMVGAAFGRRALFAGGLVGGLVGSIAGAWLASRFGWIQRTEVKATAAGAALGFLAATAIAVNTLHSPVGPILSTLLIGAGGLVGRRIGQSGR
jgi:hypothetical protein